MKKRILNTISDLVLNFTYYDRKEDEELTMEALAEAVEDGTITIEEMVATFEKELRDGLCDDCA